MTMLVMKMLKEEKEMNRIYEFWHGCDGLVLVKKEDTNIRPGYICHQHLDDGLMPNDQVGILAGSGDYGMRLDIHQC
ncbi:hypothetical protein ACLOJK_019138 [Asimina triloba]